jgi:hypothetical protein
MNNDYIEYRWPCLQERLNQSFKNLHIATEANESKMIKPLHRHYTIAEKIRACFNKLINQFQK